MNGRSHIVTPLLCAVALIFSACGDRTNPWVSRLDGSADASDAQGSEAFGEATDTELPPLELRVATFNVLRFFDTTCDSTYCGGNAYEDAPSYPAFANRAAEIAAAITELDADIVLLQEVESEACIKALTDKLDGRYPVAIIGETFWAGSLDVAVLAPEELVLTRKHRQEDIPRPGGGETQFAREFLEIHLDMGGHPVIVFVGHFKSKVHDDSDRRLAEAMAAHDIVEETAAANPDALVVFGGDLNDSPGSPPLDALEDDGKLLRVASELPAAQQGTYEYGGTEVALDHIFHALDSSGHYVPGSVRIVRDSADGLGGSDHAALTAEFAVGGP